MESSIPTPPYDGVASRQPVSRKSPSVSSSTSALSSVVRASKSGNGSSSNTASPAGPANGLPHHHNSHRASKRASIPFSTHSHGSTAHSHGSPHHDSDGRHKRVWKACERCRMKKTKCDGEFPCKRCKDDGLVCTAGTRKKTEYKQLPKGYAEVLENTQFALVATVHKLYAMVRNAQGWDLGEPELNERGQPVIHSIASKLGCIRPNNDPDLPLGTSFFPENESELAELAAQLEEHQKQHEAEQAAAAAAAAVAAQSAQATATATAPMAVPVATTSASAAALLAANGGLSRYDRASSSDLDGFSEDLDDYRKSVFGTSNDSSAHSASTAMSPQSLSFHDLDGVADAADSFTGGSPILAAAPVAAAPWTKRPASMDLSAQSLQQLHQQQQAQQAQLQAQAQAQLQRQQIQQFQKMQQQKRQQQQPPQPPPQPQPQPQPQHLLSLQQSPHGLSISVPSAMVTAMTGLPFVESPGSAFFGMDPLRQGLVESSFGTIKPHVLSCPNPEVMLGMGDPMIYAGGYDDMML